VLAADGHLDSDGLARVGRVLLEHSGYTPRRLENSLDDLVRRGHLAAPAADALARGLRAAGVLPPAGATGARWRRALVSVPRARPAPAPPAACAAERTPLDYDAILDRLRGGGAR
jgi:hypothetical protein